jgi:hypothetical protein
MHYYEDKTLTCCCELGRSRKKAKILDDLMLVRLASKKITLRTYRATSVSRNSDSQAWKSAEFVGSPSRERLAACELVGSHRV